MGGEAKVAVSPIVTDFLGTPKWTQVATENDLRLWQATKKHSHFSVSHLRALADAFRPSRRYRTAAPANGLANIRWRKKRVKTEATLALSTRLVELLQKLRSTMSNSGTARKHLKVHLCHLSCAYPEANVESVTYCEMTFPHRQKNKGPPSSSFKV